MKKYILLISFIYFTFNINAQVISETVSINPNYTHQVFYSMQNGAFPAEINTNWDIAFQIRGFAGSILINSRENVHLYKAMKNITEWNTMTAADTTGILNSAYELYNSDESWDYGAFSNTYDTANAFDLGWGVYDFITHVVTGDSVFFIQLTNGDIKKLAIESLTTGVYYFRWADVDGSNEVTATVDKSLFINKYFAYYSIVNNTTIDREPVYNQWDLTFTQYLAVSPIIDKVTGVLSNDSVFVAKAYPVDVNTVTPWGQSYNAAINTIGYDWKNYDFVTNSWTIEDSLVYFVQDRNEVIWKMIFTGFGGAANGNFEFTKEQVGIASVAEKENAGLLALYPNPASNLINLVITSEKSVTTEIRIFNQTGQLVYETSGELAPALNTLQVPVQFPSGIYHLSLQKGQAVSGMSFVVE